ncbi:MULTISPECIES: ABC transporter permease [unclassified Brenneria]|uniref:ABC transporter permease n=1 Tax=unclassified Brenneria TaxID=2634434 RepID=UPI001552FA28|nr:MULTISPECIES: ABC transporter permease [unclassified Brenneria]MBJ7221232.1 ABC transporter permease [Brenneria sp. L3-3C-1]MEE3642475.1 ABC transporter permease [Brenneria sp. L3_3C_1]MEE3650161.1 ABC transporter permease [Brenneria sp. HEZEL_4_2_4]NPD00119.1 ABC transporter permease [Brenneria sp. hezel4-2-4]
MSRARSLSSLLAQRLFLLSLFLLIWWLAALRMPSFILPGPEKTWQALHLLWHNGTLLNDIGVTLSRVVMGFIFATLIGTPLGLALGASRRLAQFFEPLLAVFNSVSSAIWAIFAIIWFGISNATTVFVVFMTAMPLILTNVWQGAQTVEAQYVELARSFRMNRWQTLLKIYLPTILPYFFSGARLAFGFGWRVSLVAETLGASNGIGYRLRQAGDLVQTDQVFAWTLLLVTLMLLLEGGILKPLERRLFRWKKLTQE